MSVPAHVYQVYIAASPEQVWAAITESEWTRRFFHATSFVEPPRLGKPYRTVVADGRPAIEGMIEEMEPPAEGSPGRFVQTWHTSMTQPWSMNRPAGWSGPSRLRATASLE